MQEHLHLPLSEPQRMSLADALKSLKQEVSLRLAGEAKHFWQKRYYDGNVRDYKEFLEKLRLVGKAGGLGVEQLPPLCHQGRGTGGNRVRVDGKKTRAGSGTTLSRSANSPLKPKVRFEWAPAQFLV